MIRTLAGIVLIVAFAYSCATLGEVAVTRSHPSGGTASSTPPGGLTAEQVPQFVHFGFDDNGISGQSGSGTDGGLTFVTDLFAGKVNPAGTGNSRTYDGTPVNVSFYVVTEYIERPDIDEPEHLKRQWRAMVDAGHELGIHTHSHPHGRLLTAGKWSQEIATSRSWLTKPFDSERAADEDTGIGMQSIEMSGFRAPYLEYDSPLFAALRDSDITYDCSIEEGFGDDYDGTNLLWPYRILSPGGTATELWEIPVYILTVPPDDQCENYGVPPGLRARLATVVDYFDPDDGKITGFDWNLWVAFGMTQAEVVATLKYSLDLRMSGNRAPLTFGTHSDIYSGQYPADTPNSTASDRQQALQEILEYALSKPDVRVVSAQQILDWVRDPVGIGKEGKEGQVQIPRGGSVGGR
ncbi:MAG: polysaccharide deacetylase family protein [Acidimicrobiia bacterium]|nr:polysaccharide deacetylase family protein [Acidimicrobiia bacterium]